MPELRDLYGDRRFLFWPQWKRGFKRRRAVRRQKVKSKVIKVEAIPFGFTDPLERLEFHVWPTVYSSQGPTVCLGPQALATTAFTQAEANELLYHLRGLPMPEIWVTYAEAFKAEGHPISTVAALTGLQMVDFHLRPIENSPVRQLVDQLWFDVANRKLYKYQIKALQSRLNRILRPADDSRGKAALMSHWAEACEKYSFVPWEWHGPYQQRYSVGPVKRKRRALPELLIPEDPLEGYHYFWSRRVSRDLAWVEDTPKVPTVRARRVSVSVGPASYRRDFPRVLPLPPLSSLPPVTSSLGLSRRPFLNHEATSNLSPTPQPTDIGPRAPMGGTNHPILSLSSLLARIKEIPTDDAAGVIAKRLVDGALKGSTALIDVSPQEDWFYLRATHTVAPALREELYGVLYLHLVTQTGIPEMLEDGLDLLVGLLASQGVFVRAHRSDIRHGRIPRFVERPSETPRLTDRLNPAVDYRFAPSKPYSYLAAHPVTWAPMDARWATDLHDSE